MYTAQHPTKRSSRAKQTLIWRLWAARASTGATNQRVTALLKTPAARARACCEGRSNRGRARTQGKPMIITESRRVTDPQRPIEMLRGDRQKEKRDDHTQTHFTPLLVHFQTTTSFFFFSHGRDGIPLDVVPAAAKRRGYFVTTPGSSLDQGLAAKTRGKDSETRRPCCFSLCFPLFFPTTPLIQCCVQLQLVIPHVVSVLQWNHLHARQDGVAWPGWLLCGRA